MTKHNFKLRMNKAKNLLTNDGIRLFGKGKFDMENKRLYSDDGTWYLQFHELTNSVSIEDVDILTPFN